MEKIMSSSKVVAIFVSLMMSYIFAGTIHINGYAELPNGDSGTAGSEVRYKNITQNTLPVIGFLDADGKYSVDLIVDPSGINDTTIGYSARAYGNNIIISGTDVERINVYNSKGQLVKKASFNAKNGITRGSFETGGLSTGLYFINVDTKSKSFTLKTNIFEGQSSLMPDLMSLPASKQGTGKSAKIYNDFEVKILAPSGEFAAYTDTLTFSIPDTGVESWENPVHALSYNSPSKILGYVQKGPFITGSSVQIQELNNSLTPNGNTYNVSTEDNFGSFVLETLIPTKYIEVISTGFYFNEVSGSLSEANLTLRAIAETDKVLGCNVNILTSLAKKRIVYLVTTEGKTFTEAKIQAQNEILAVFSIDGTGAADFEDMDISESGDSNGMLLAVSAILQGNNTVAELSSLISTIIEDVKTDGILDNADAKNEIIENAKYLSLISVRKNIEDRYDALGLTAVIPNFEQYINNIWVNQPPTCQITKLECVQTMGTVTSTLSALDGKPLVIGSQATVQVSSTDTDGTVSKIKIYLDNVLADSTSMGNYTWTIADTTKFHTIKVIAFDDDGAQSVDSVNYELFGSAWIKVSDNQPFSPSFTSFATTEERIFGIDFSNENVYSSFDGISWTKTSRPPIFYHDIIPLNNKVWISNGVATCRTEDGTAWTGGALSGIENWELYDGQIFTFGAVNLFGLFQYALFDDDDMIIKEDTGVFSQRNDSLIFLTDEISIIKNYPRQPCIVQIGNEVFIYSCNGSKSAIRSNNCINWYEEADVLPFDTAPTYNPYKNRTTQIINVNGIVYAVTDKGEIWTSSDGRSWNKDEILVSPIPIKLFAFGENLWLFEDDFLNTTSVNPGLYYLKKYFE
jgi:hypothetical protein